MKESIKEKLAEPIRNFRLPRYRELPDVGLYLEQVVRYVNRYMILDGNELTASMVSNYVKQKLIPGPVKNLTAQMPLPICCFCLTQRWWCHWGISIL